MGKKTDIISFILHINVYSFNNSFESLIDTTDNEYVTKTIIRTWLQYIKVISLTSKRNVLRYEEKTHLYNRIYILFRSLTLKVINYA